MSIGSINSSTVEMLKSHSTELCDAMSEIKTATDRLSGVVDDNTQCIGPHAREIGQILDSIRGNLSQCINDVNCLSQKFSYTADRIQEILDTDIFASNHISTE